MSEPLFHIALVEDWIDAFANGEYRMSTRSMSLDDVGFIHMSTRAQLIGTARSEVPGSSSARSGS